MGSAVNILNVQKAPAQTQVRAAQQSSDNLSSFLNLLQNAAGLNRTEKADTSGNNWNKTENSAGIVKNNDLNQKSKINDINNVKISLKDTADNIGGLSVLAKVLNGETAELAGLEEINIIEEIKKEAAGIVVKDEESEKIDVSKILEIIGVPAEIIREMTAAVTEPEFIYDDVNAGQVQEVAAAVSKPEAAAPVLVSAGEAEDFITRVSEYIYSEKMAEIIESPDGLPEQVQENIADLADIIAETGDIKSAVAEYAADKIEANNPEAAVKLNAENIKEAVRQVLNDEPELEVLSAGKTSEAVQEKTAPTMFDILNSMKRAVNFTQVQTADIKAEIMQEIAGPEEIRASVNPIEVKIAESLPVAETNVNPVNEVEVNNLAGILNARADLQNPDGEVNIEGFARDISRVIAEKSQVILNQAGEPKDEAFELRLRLKPAELGELFMKITYRNGYVGLNIIAANAAAERAILSQMGDLRASLEAHEISLIEADVNNFNNYTQGQNSNQSSSGSKNNRDGNQAFGLNEAKNIEETERREAVANYIKSRRIFYKTI